MSLKSHIVPRMVERMFSWDGVLKARAKFERSRVAAGDSHVAEFFHDPTDPYSQLLQQVLPEFQNRYNVELRTHLVGPPDDGAAPERQALEAYSRIDAARLAQKAGIDFTFTPSPPASETAQGDARRAALGYYLGGAIYYGGEWYWGLDRLHYLETWLTDLGLGDGGPPIYAPPIVPSGAGESGVELHWYLSLRSPYTAIVAGRVKALAEAYGAKVKLRFVLPMVMRDLPVPKAKRLYIIKDAAREAHRLGVPYGRICDPVGKPVERAYSLLPWAIKQGRGLEFADSFLTKVWSQGLDAGSDRGMRKIVEGAGLSWATARDLMGNDDWRSIAEANRLEMMDYGIWGVPSFRVGDTITWGQDRLWVIEDALKTLT